VLTGQAVDGKDGRITRVKVLRHGMELDSLCTPGQVGGKERVNAVLGKEVRGKADKGNKARREIGERECPEIVFVQKPVAGKIRQNREIDAGISHIIQEGIDGSISCWRERDQKTLIETRHDFCGDISVGEDVGMPVNDTIAVSHKKNIAVFKLAGSNSVAWRAGHPQEVPISGRPGIVHQKKH